MVLMARLIRVSYLLTSCSFVWESNLSYDHSPGSSAQYLNLGGLGPLTLNNDLSLQASLNSITGFANVMFLDLLGSGYSIPASTADIPTSAKGFAQQLTYAINAFLTSTAIGKTSTLHLVG
jgi:carboxypeptidase C (cathepsin A)